MQFCPSVPELGEVQKSNVWFLIVSSIKGRHRLDGTEGFRLSLLRACTVSAFSFRIAVGKLPNSITLPVIEWNNWLPSYWRQPWYTMTLGFMEWWSMAAECWLLLGGEVWCFSGSGRCYRVPRQSHRILKSFSYSSMNRFQDKQENVSGKQYML